MGWQLIEQLRGWSIDWVHAGRRGLTIWAHQRILIRTGQTAAEERCVAAHETVHAMRGPFPRWMLTREEEAVSRAAARYLIDIHELGEALAWSLCLHEVADELHLDVQTSEARLRGLHPSERAFLRRRLEHHTCEGR